MICDACHRESDVYSRVLTRSGFQTRCRSCKAGKVRPSCYDPFSHLVLDHVRDEQDRPVTVTSLRQLREVEKQHKCLSAVANLDASHVDEPPQRKNPTVGDLMSQEGRWLYPEIGPRMYREMQESGEVV